MSDSEEKNIPEYIEMEWEEFTKQFKPQQNHLDDNASLDGLMYETFGPEIDHVCAIANESRGRVWTYVDDGDDACLVNGYHYCNRLGYVITELEATPNTYISVID